MELGQRYRGYITLTLICAIVFGSYLLYERRPRPEAIEIIEATAAPTGTEVPIQVHVAGAVREPGVHALPRNSRLIDALEAAGGLTADADQEQLNLADYVRDGQRVYVPGIGTPPPPSPTPSGAQGREAESSDRVGAPINVNTASAAELEALPGIGPAYAQRIIAYRETHGPFTDPAQLMEVKGIGKLRYERIKGEITVR